MIDMHADIEVCGKRFKAKAEYDQHFMTDQEMLSLIVDLASPSSNDFVLEIGPGNGSLTRILCKRAGKVTAVEIDGELVKILREKLRLKNLKIVNCDAIEYIRKNRNSFTALVSNLPYMIAEPLLVELAKNNFRISVLTISNSFAEKLTVKANLPKATMMTFFSRAFFDVEFICRVSKDAFIPKPRKESAIIKITPLKPEDYKERKPEFIMRELFLQPEKKLKNALLEAMINYEKRFGSASFGKRAAKSLLSESGFDFMDKKAKSLNAKDIKKIYFFISGS